MAVNPMQRRARSAFLVGFLIALIIMAVVVVFILYQLKLVKEENNRLVSAQSKVLVASSDLKSGAKVTIENFTTETVQTSVNQADIVSSDDFEFKDSDGNVETRIDDSGATLSKELMMKISVPKGTIVTKDMLEESEDQISNSQRIQEFNMIALPSRLVNGDYVDIRLSLPNGQDFVVLTKKEVLGTESTSIWLKLTEDELLTLNNAVVESYTITGSKLYAIQYVEPGRQEQATATYTVSQAVLYLMSTDHNITQDAYNALRARYNSDTRINYFEAALDENRDNQDSLVSAGVASEIEAIKSAREAFVESLEGTEDIGYSK